MPHLVVAVLGHRHTGKSTTWNALFGATVRTGKYERRLYLNKSQYVNVFLVSGSPEEREEYVGEIITAERPSIVLCSTQYIAGVQKTYEYFFRNGYQPFVQWLNPGHGDPGKYPDSIALLPYLLDSGATVQTRDGNIDPAARVREIVQHVLGWATYHDLVRTEFGV
jgi:hypothetical protein